MEEIYNYNGVDSTLPRAASIKDYPVVNTAERIVVMNSLQGKKKYQVEKYVRDINLIATCLKNHLPDITDEIIENIYDIMEGAVNEDKLYALIELRVKLGFTPILKYQEEHICSNFKTMPEEVKEKFKEENRQSKFYKEMVAKGMRYKKEAIEEIIERSNRLAAISQGNLSEAVISALNEAILGDIFGKS